MPKPMPPLGNEVSIKLWSSSLASESRLGVSGRISPISDRVDSDPSLVVSVRAVKVPSGVIDPASAPVPIERRNGAAAPAPYSAVAASGLVATGGSRSISYPLELPHPITTTPKTSREGSSLREKESTCGCFNREKGRRFCLFRRHIEL